MKKTLFTLFSIIIIDLIGFGIVIPVLPFYAKSLGANATILGALLTSYAAMQFIFSPLWGKLSDRIGRRPVMIMTILGSSIALALLGWAPSLLWLFIARILGGIFGANISVATAYVGDITTAENRTRWMGMIGASFGIGFILGPALGGFLAPYGYSLPMYVAAGLALLNTIYAFIVLKEPPQHQHTSDVKADFVPNDQKLRRLNLINFCFTVAITQLEAIFAFYMKDRFGYDAHHVAYILVGMALLMAFIQGGVIRQLAKRFGELQLLTSGAFLLLLAYCAIPWMPQVSLLLLPLGIAALGRSLVQPSLLTLTSHQSQNHTRGAIMGRFQSSASLGRVIGPTVAGFLYDHTRAAPFGLAAALFLGVLTLAQQLKTTPESQ